MKKFKRKKGKKMQPFSKKSRGSNRISVVNPESITLIGALNTSSDEPWNFSRDEKKYFY